jgi:putative addiction module CopG family antidote
MRNSQAISITLPHDMLDMIRGKVASGEYASESEVIRDGQRTLRARDAAVEKWLHQDVMAAHEAYLKDPSRGSPAEEVFARLRAHHAAQFADAKDL